MNPRLTLSTLLLKNNDGQITSDELRPKGPPPPRESGPDSGERRGDRQRPPEGEL